MEQNRIINIILAELSLDNLKQQENLERAINENNEIGTKILKVKDVLKSLALNELMINKFQYLLEPNNKNLNQTQNG